MGVNPIVFTILKTIGGALILGGGMIPLIRSIAEALFNKKKLRIEIYKVWSVAFLFYLSIDVVYHNLSVTTPGLDLLAELGVSACLGLLWSWCFFVGAKACGKTFESASFLRLWPIMSVLAFAIFVLSR